MLIRTQQELKLALQPLHETAQTIGLVPTMGALHKGHASLVERALQENDVTVVSIFVNPTQFNDANDLKNYPRTLEDDYKLLDSLGVDYVYAPTVEDVYPTPDTRHFSYPPIDTVMEGARRPGHFNGVCQIVSKLFDIVKPTRAYFGEKDFQQIAVIKAMAKDLRLDIEICPCPIIREESGLALSSRNTLLTAKERNTAVCISAALRNSVEFAKQHSVNETHNLVVGALNATQGLEVEYFEIVNGDTLQPVHSWEEATHIVGCITVYCGQRPVRLIDNIKYKG